MSLPPLGVLDAGLVTPALYETPLYETFYEMLVETRGPNLPRFG